MNDDRDQDYKRALDAFHRAVHAAYQTWVDTRDEPWPRWGNMSPRQLADLGIPELPARPEPEPLPPHRDPIDPGFVVHWLLHPSMYTAVPDPSRPPGYQAAVQAKVDTQKAALRDARDACAAAGNRCAIPVNLRPISLLKRAGQLTSSSTITNWEAEEHAHQAYMKFIEHLAERRGQTLDQYLAFQEAESDAPKREHDSREGLAPICSPGPAQAETASQSWGADGA
jgi:hypothetical protein